MRTIEQIEADFRKDFQALLDKYGADFDASTDLYGYTSIDVYIWADEQYLDFEMIASHSATKEGNT